MMHNIETPEVSHEVDSWHSHTAGELTHEEHASHVNMHGLLIAFVLIAGFVGLTVFSLIVFFDYSATTMREKVVENTNEYRTGFMPYAEQAKSRISNYSWVNRDERSVQVPWDVAARQVVKGYSN